MTKRTLGEEITRAIETYYGEHPSLSVLQILKALDEVRHVVTEACAAGMPL